MSDEALIQIITQISDTIIRSIMYDDHGHVIKITLSGDGQNDPPPDLWSLSHLRFLRLSHFDQMEHLPPEIGQLTQLQTLEVVKCTRLRALPMTLQSLAQLEILDLQQNHFEDFPIALFALPRLKTLDIQNNAIQILPDGIAQMHTLEQLKLDENPLRILPTTIGQLSNLRSLHITSSPLQSLPEEMYETQAVRKALSYAPSSASHFTSDWKPYLTHRFRPAFTSHYIASDGDQTASSFTSSRAQ